MDPTRRPNHNRIPVGLSVSGELTADEDIIVDGRFEGQMSVPNHHVTISASAVVRAKVVAHAVVIQGTVDGTVIAAERITVENTATVTGHLTTPSLLLVEGATFTGSVDSARTEAAMEVAKYRQRHS